MKKMMKKKTLGFKLISGGIVAVLIPLLVVGIYAVFKSSNALETLSKENALNTATDLASMADLVLKEEMKIAAELASGNTTVAVASKVNEEGAENADSEIESLNRKLSSAVKGMGNDYELLVAADANGNVFADAMNGKLKGISIADREYFRSAKAEKRVTVSDPVKSKSSGKPVVPVCAPIFSADGKFVGAVTSVLKIDFLADRIASVKIGRTGYPCIIDKSGLILAHPKKEYILDLNIRKLAGMETLAKKAASGKSGIESYVFKGVDKIAGYAPVRLTGWSVLVTQTADEFLATSRNIRDMILFVGLLFLTATVATVFFFARSISKPIQKGVDMLNDASDQVAAASAQVSSAGQSLAEGASEQASSLEETSSSLEEMASMTRKNAEHAQQADQLMKEANDVIKKATDTMNKMTRSMDNISRTSEETQKIIKTIDEIAFQTNLLALNAAVEAARAGEAGAGFAVVADEVRNLAMRAAEAAKNTSNLIEGSVKQIKEGSEFVNTTNSAFSEVAASASKVAQLVAEIAAASNEQAQGIEQVNQAVAEMDKVTQLNAANAEESASASEEMSAQAEQMKGIVKDLAAVIGGQVDDEEVEYPEQVVQVRHEKERHASRSVKKGKNRGLTLNGAREVKPEQVIPFDEDDFKDF